MVSSQKFIARNRAPRVQIEYDVELYGAEKKVQLPFVMGVMSDLAGKSEEPQPAVADRKFLEIDVDNFDSRMKSMKPRAAFVVPNTLTGEGNMAVDITFESMDDFSPAAIAAKVEPLKKLLDARTQLANLTTYMDGKTGAESLIEAVLQDKNLLSALASGNAQDMAQGDALNDLRARSAEIAAAQSEAQSRDRATQNAALDALRAAAPAKAPADALADLLADAAPTIEAIETEVEQVGIAALIEPQEEDALAALLADDEPDPLDFDDLLAEFDDRPTRPPAGDDLPLKESEDSMSLLDDLLGETALSAKAVKGFGHLTAPEPSAESLSRRVFKIALFGDFSGRAARGMMEVGDKLATCPGIALDVDTVEEVIEGFATELVLPIGPEGKGISLQLNGLDDLHPDEMVENLDIFAELRGLRARLANPSTAASAVAQMQGWSGDFTTGLTATRAQSSAASIPANKTLSDFQRLIGDTTGRLSQPSPIADLIGQIVGPHIVPGPNPEAQALQRAVDEAMSSAMRLVLHHPDFQALESQWRLLDLLARRIETDVKLSITLFDLSAAELAADLSASDDLAQSGLFRLLNASLQDEEDTGFSAICGLYSFEETPPHAELLGRLSKIAAHVQAPAFAAMTPGFMEIDLRDRHPLTAAAWDKLRAEPSAAYLGLAAPRFLLRRPYGKKTEPIDAFEFEEFTQSEGLRGMLWANPVGLVAILLAQSWKQNGAAMELGKIMSLDDIPFHFVTDKHGDQVALPCTERNLTESVTQRVTGRGFMPVVSIRGRDVIRLASFQSLAGAPICGPWSGAPAPRPAPKSSPLDIEMEIVAPTESPTGNTAGELDELDALLAEFDDIAAPTDPDSIDAELAALLEGL